jgi:hypothetical protein
MLTGIESGMVASRKMQKKTPPVGISASATKAPKGGMNISAGINSNR